MELIGKDGTETRKVNRKSKLAYRFCNICKDEFKPKTIFDRYCLTCRKESELLKFISSFPEADETILEKVPA